MSPKIKTKSRGSLQRAQCSKKDVFQHGLKSNSERLLILLILAFCLSVFFSAQAVFALPPRLEHINNDMRTGIPDSAAGPNQPKPRTPAISETFDVTKHLTTPGQTPLVPSTEQNGQDKKPEGVVAFGIKVINLLVGTIGSVALIVFIIGALLTVTSEGKEDRLEKGKSAMLYALIGLIIAFFSFVIVTFVQSIFF